MAKSIFPSHDDPRVQSRADAIESGMPFYLSLEPCGNPTHHLPLWRYVKSRHCVLCRRVRARTLLANRRTGVSNFIRALFEKPPALVPPEDRNESSLMSAKLQGIWDTGVGKWEYTAADEATVFVLEWVVDKGAGDYTQGDLDCILEDEREKLRPRSKKSGA